jgi:hypothetical protein
MAEHETPLGVAAPKALEDVMLVSRHEHSVVWHYLDQTHLLAARHAEHPLPHQQAHL